MVKNILIILCISLFLSCSLSRDKELQAEGNDIIKEIEKFEQQNGRLPASLGEIGKVEKEEGPIYYKKISDTHYQIWYGRELGESVTFDSEKKIWE